MVKSMTAYGRGEYEHEDDRFIAEIKSLNNRYRDIVLRTPKEFQSLDNELRSIISSRVRRGRVEVSLKIENGGKAAPYDLELNMPLAHEYFKIFDQLTAQFGIERKISLEAFCQLKDVILARPLQKDIQTVASGFKEVLKNALDSLEEMKMKEGAAIQADFSFRLGLLEEALQRIENRAPELITLYRKRLEEKMEQISKDIAVDEERIFQEITLFADRSDISEELVRLKSHIKQFRDYQTLDDALGRRLEFLIQEMHREANTLSVKASDSSISKIVVEMKTELEKLREQVQNVE